MCSLLFVTSKIIITDTYIKTNCYIERTMSGVKNDAHAIIQCIDDGIIYTLRCVL